MGPIRHALEELKRLAHAFGVSTEEAADRVDAMNAVTSRQAKAAAKTVADAVAKASKREST